jgi:hypothetical protein
LPVASNVKSAPKPPVSDLSQSTVSSPAIRVSVAPWWRACASRSSERSTATMRSAPASRAPITAPSPTSPQPKTTHVDPGSTRAV